MCTKLKFNPLTATLELVGGKGSTIIKDRVATFADLPAGEDPGTLFVVEQDTGSVLLFNKKEAGIYRWNGTIWEAYTDVGATSIETDDTNIGAGSTNLQNTLEFLNTNINTNNIDNRVIVKQASDLINIDSSKIYLIDGKIDMGTTQIEVPTGGFFYRGLDYFVSSLYSTADNYTMFINKTGENAGNIRGTNVEHYVSGTNSQVFNLDNQGNFGSCEFISCNFGTFATDTTSLGNLDNFRQFRTADTAFIKILDGIEFNGTWSGGMSVSDTILLSIANGVTMFKEGTSLLFQGSVSSNINALSIGATTIVFDFQESNFDIDWGFNLEAARFPNINTAIPNINVQSIKRYFKDCRGLENTFVGGGWKLTTEIITPLVVNIGSKINGITTYSNLVHTSGTLSNELVYESNISSDFILSGDLVIDGGPNDEITVTVRKFVNATSSYEDVEEYERTISNVVGGNDVAYFSFNTPVQLDADDRIELWVTNTTDNTSITLQQGSSILLEER